MKIVEVEIHHLAEDETGSIVRVILTLTLADGSHREIEVTIPEIGNTETL